MRLGCLTAKHQSGLSRVGSPDADTIAWYVVVCSTKGRVGEGFAVHLLVLPIHHADLSAQLAAYCLSLAPSEGLDDRVMLRLLAHLFCPCHTSLHCDVAILSTRAILFEIRTCSHPYSTEVVEEQPPTALHTRRFTWTFASGSEVGSPLRLTVAPSHIAASPPQKIQKYIPAPIAPREENNHRCRLFILFLLGSWPDRMLDVPAAYRKALESVLGLSLASTADACPSTSLGNARLSPQNLPHHKAKAP